MNSELIDAAVEMLDAETTLILNIVDRMNGMVEMAKAKDNAIRVLLLEVSRLTGVAPDNSVPDQNQEMLRIQVKVLQEVCNGITEAIGVLRVVGDNLSGGNHG